MTLRLEIKDMKDIDAVRLMTRIVRELGTGIDNWQHNDELYSIDFKRDEEQENKDIRTSDRG